MTDTYNPVLTYQFGVQFHRGIHPLLMNWDPSDDHTCWHCIRHFVAAISDFAADEADTRIHLQNSTGTGPRADRHEVPLLATAIYDEADTARDHYELAGIVRDEDDALMHLGKYRAGVRKIIAMINRAIENYEAGGDEDRLAMAEHVYGGMD